MRSKYWSRRYSKPAVVSDGVLESLSLRSRGPAHPIHTRRQPYPGSLLRSAVLTDWPPTQESLNTHTPSHKACSLFFVCRLTSDLVHTCPFLPVCHLSWVRKTTATCIYTRYKQDLTCVAMWRRYCSGKLVTGEQCAPGATRHAHAHPSQFGAAAEPRPCHNALLSVLNAARASLATVLGCAAAQDKCVWRQQLSQFVHAPPLVTARCCWL